MRLKATLRNNGSLYVTIPLEIVKDLELEEEQDVFFDVEKDDDDVDDSVISVFLKKK